MVTVPLEGFATMWPLTAPTPADVAAANLPLIQAYFPASQQDFATCTMEQEVGVALAACSDPTTCVIEQPDPISCYTGQTAGPASGYGLYQILDVCWNPALAGTNTPFTADEWANVLDPNYNVWMASVIWSIGGWRAWTTCGQCNACDVVGGPVPYPRGPVIPAPTSTTGTPYYATPLYLAVAGVGTVGALMLLALKDQIP